MSPGKQQQRVCRNVFGVLIDVKVHALKGISFLENNFGVFAHRQTTSEEKSSALGQSRSWFCEAVGQNRLQVPFWGWESHPAVVVIVDFTGVAE